MQFCNRDVQNSISRWLSVWKRYKYFSMKLSDALPDLDPTISFSWIEWTTSPKRHASSSVFVLYRPGCVKRLRIRSRWTLLSLEETDRFLDQDIRRCQFQVSFALSLPLFVSSPPLRAPSYLSASELSMQHILIIVRSTWFLFYSSKKSIQVLMLNIIDQILILSLSNRLYNRNKLCPEILRACANRTHSRIRAYHIYKCQGIDKINKIDRIIDVLTFLAIISLIDEIRVVRLPSSKDPIVR